MSVASCSKWFDVKPKKMVEQEALFESENGFKEALTGAYLLMGQRGIYGGTVTFGFLDRLAQYYNTTTSGTAQQQDKLNYIFPSTITESYVNSVWGKSYNIIANLNNLLHYLDKNRDVLTTKGYYEIIKGEALGLRAFLHFDLLRIYGKIYKDGKNSLSIVYRTEFNPDSKMLLPSSKIVALILEDLKNAEILLQNDAMSLEFPQTAYDEERMDGDKFLVYRHKRMNLYAVKGLAARVNMYAGESVEAARYATEVIESDLFKLVQNNTDDRIFSTELLFSLYIPNFEKLRNDYFSPSHSYAIDNEKFLDEIFSAYTDGKNDIRYKAYKAVGSHYVLMKYDQTSIWASIESTVPLIRLSEMYYILAECATDYTQSCIYLNAVRVARGLDEVSYGNESDKLLNLEKEYRKEFSGEGQLFFFYKRHGYKTFLHCPIKDMKSENYTFSLPENEQLFGGVE